MSFSFSPALIHRASQFAIGAMVAGMIATVSAAPASADPHYYSINPSDFLPLEGLIEQGLGACAVMPIHLPHGSTTRHISLTAEEPDIRDQNIPSSTSEEGDILVDVIFERRGIDGKSIILPLEERIVIGQFIPRGKTTRYKFPLETKINNRANTYALFLCSNLREAALYFNGGHLKFDPPAAE